jgi:hypothetical protein
MPTREAKYQSTPSETCVKQSLANRGFQVSVIFHLYPVLSIAGFCFEYTLLNTRKEPACSAPRDPLLLGAGLQRHPKLVSRFQLPLRCLFVTFTHILYLMSFDLYIYIYIYISISVILREGTGNLGFDKF